MRTSFVPEFPRTMLTVELSRSEFTIRRTPQGQDGLFAYLYLSRPTHWPFWIRWHAEALREIIRRLCKGTLQICTYWPISYVCMHQECWLALHLFSQWWSKYGSWWDAEKAPWSFADDEATFNELTDNVYVYNQPDERQERVEQRSIETSVATVGICTISTVMVDGPSVRNLNMSEDCPCYLRAIISQLRTRVRLHCMYRNTVSVIISFQSGYSNQAIAVPHVDNEEHR